MTTSRIVKEARELDEEILWFRSFGWSNERIANRLRVSLHCIERHDKHRQQAQEETA